ncbi:hypothetical protein [Pedobacter zeae]|uniref:Uncharacterized protein n=1 Tax=Pedobacter zeae TaxID=1737356 RepID=A0A7W6KB08_9SPHI|nr:hypothetical protein [Pedobacter zeae]MBB4108342.1 hypothetical protein [Pedobacter zeae]GGG93422.1 hypothetical protein GCM10007422_03310 [Pedobacter zeae]
MNTGKSLSKRDILKENILALARGQKSPKDIYPDCLCKIGYGEDNIYLINDKEVGKEEFDRASANLDCEGFTITYGGKI